MFRAAGFEVGCIQVGTSHVRTLSSKVHLRGRRGAAELSGGWPWREDSAVDDRARAEGWRWEVVSAGVVWAIGWDGAGAGLSRQVTTGSGGEGRGEDHHLLRLESMRVGR